MCAGFEHGSVQGRTVGRVDESISPRSRPVSSARRTLAVVRRSLGEKVTVIPRSEATKNLLSSSAL